MSMRKGSLFRLYSMGRDDQDQDVYRPPQDKQQDIVDVVCNIMDDDGPRPMKFLKPAQKQRNAVDQFYTEHQSPYEERGRTSRDRVEMVHQHNSGYPKLHDELNKKRSTTKVTPFSGHRLAVSQQANKNAAGRSKKNSDSNKKDYSRKYCSLETRERARPRRRNRSKISKPKSRRARNRRSSSKMFKLLKVKTNRGCQCSSYYLAKDKRSGTDNIPPDLDDKMAVEEVGACQCANNISQEHNQPHTCDSSHCSKDSCRKNNTHTEPSVRQMNPPHLMLSEGEVQTRRYSSSTCHISHPDLASLHVASSRLLKDPRSIFAAPLPECAARMTSHLLPPSRLFDREDRDSNKRGAFVIASRLSNASLMISYK
ncbi:hypothetical protein evm_006309 [Chilo suppressalis]|nr:hypothetical protein evm_006309 [Chilo suppressalis]